MFLNRTDASRAICVGHVRQRHAKIGNSSRLLHDVERRVRIQLQRRNEFPEIEAGKKQGAEQEVEQLLLLRGAMSATEIAEELGRNRSNISGILSSSDRFQVVRHEGKAVLYGVRQHYEPFVAEN